jgi:hypothetical protein
MNETIRGMKNMGTGVPSIAGNTIRLGAHGSNSETPFGSQGGGGIGYTPSIMSPMKGTGIGLNLGGPDTTLYSVPSPIRM